MDSFLRAGPAGNIEQSLVGLGVLHDGGCLPLYRQDHRALTFSELLHEVTESTTKGRQRLDVLVMSSMGLLLLQHLFSLGAVGILHLCRIGPLQQNR
jgi:hypothetical protein